MLVEAKLKPTVAHFDHRQRSDSNLDCQLVESLAEKYRLKLYSGVGNLAKGVNESQLRQARYQFLNKINKRLKLKRLLRLIIKMIYSKQWLSTFFGKPAEGFDQPKKPPRLNSASFGDSKQKLIEYAKTKELNWREDSTNTDLRF